MQCWYPKPRHIKPLAQLLQPFKSPTSITQSRQRLAVPLVFPRTIQSSARIRHASIPTTGHVLSQLDTKDASPQQALYDLSLSLSRTPTNENTSVQYTMYNSTGAALSTTHATKSAIASKHGLSTRDLRTIDLPSAGFPHILIRQHALVVHLFNLRLLVQSDRVLVFHVAEMVGQERDTTSRVFLHDLEGKLRGDASLGVSLSLPYELRVVEAALAAVTSVLEAEYVLARRQVETAQANLHSRMAEQDGSYIHGELRSLLSLVRSLADLESRASSIRAAVQEVLAEDQDMADMHLSDKAAGRPHTRQDHQDVEYLFEAYYKASDAVAQDAAGLRAQVNQTDESIQSILNVRRNQIMVLEARIEIVMVGLAAATLVAGLYGMNVVNGFEESTWAFGVLTALCLVGTAGISRYGMRRLRSIQQVGL
jgi:magnesium transporter